MPGSVPSGRDQSGRDPSGTDPSGTDDLFPDAPSVEGVRLRPAPTEQPGRRRMGIAALSFGLIGVVGVVSDALMTFVILFSALQGQSVADWVLPFGIGLAVGSAILAVLGIVAAVRGRGRVPGVLGAVFGAVALGILAVVLSFFGALG